MNTKEIYSKNKYMENTKKNLAYFGSNFDICNTLSCGEDKILKYSELNQYKSFQELLPNTDFDYKIILLESAKNSGHWVSILRFGDTIELFNSYGVPIDNEFKYIPQVIEEMLHETRRYLTELIKSDTNNFNVISNKIKFQSKSEKVATCSRWNCLRIECGKMGYNLAEFQRIMQSVQSKTHVPYDILVIQYINYPTDLK